jgi:hypothetical protein
MFGPHPDDMTELATPTEAVREWARNIGWYPHNIGYAYLLHDYDVWERNPHYTGPAVPHPEDDEPMSSEAAAWIDFAERVAADERDVDYWDGYAYIRVR